jgi:hypothetical protein
MHAEALVVKNRLRIQNAGTFMCIVNAEPLAHPEARQEHAERFTTSGSVKRSTPKTSPEPTL